MLVKFTSGKQLDTKYPLENNPTKSIEITACGIIVNHGDSTGELFFYPWHQVEFLVGDPGKYEHELEQLRYIATGGHNK